MRLCLSLTLLLPASSPRTNWSSVTQGLENIWPAAFSTEEMLFPRMSTPQLQPSRIRELFNLSIGAQLVSKLASTTNLPLLSLGLTWLRSQELCACYPTPPPSRTHGIGNICFFCCNAALRTTRGRMYVCLYVCMSVCLRSLAFLSFTQKI